MTEQIKRVTYKTCPLCDSKSITFFRKPGDCSRHPVYTPVISKSIIWKTCKDCGHIFTSGYFDNKDLDKVFTKTIPIQSFTTKNIMDWRRISADIIEKIVSLLPTFNDNYSKFCEIGFGNGSLLTTAKEYGFDVMGYEIRKDAVKKLKKYNIDVRCEDFFEVNWTNMFNVIAMADVLEHLPYPIDAIKNIYNALQPGGVLFISCPNTESFVWQIMDEQNNNPFWNELEHYHNFSKTRLYEILKENGFIPYNYSVSKRYLACMEVIAIKPAQP